MKTRNPAIDFLRFIAIFLVVGVHFVHLSKLSLTNPILVNRSLFIDVFRNGYLGVTIFFVTSGYLITNILLAQVTVNVKDFYIKRSAKIFPPLMLLIASCLFLYRLALIDNDVNFDALSLLWYILTFQFNFFYLAGGSGVLAFAVLWSLSIEELFYFLFPPLIKFHLEKLLTFLVVLVVVGPVARSTIGFNALFLQFGCFDAISIGALTAFGTNWLDRTSAILRELAHNNNQNVQDVISLIRQFNVITFIIGSFLLIFLIIKFYIITDYVLLPTAIAVSTALILTGCRHWRYPVSASFRSRYLISRLGNYSYEIYLFHMPIILLIQKNTKLEKMPMDISYIIIIFIIVAVCVAIHKLYSLPVQQSVASFIYRFLYLIPKRNTVV